MPKEPFKAGDRVRVYGMGNDMTARELEGTVVDVHQKTTWMKIDGSRYEGEYWVHPKQCRRLVKKPLARLWVNIYPGGHFGTHLTKEEAENAPTNGATRVAVEFIEVRKGKP